MKIVWDEPKRLANIDKHGFDFADVVFFDWANAVIEVSEQSLTSPRRMKAVGRFSDTVAVVIYAELGTEAISIVSFRTASARERRRVDA
jgi:uncharacterized protein